MSINDELLTTEKVYKTIRHAIIIGKLKPREKLATSRLAEILGVSRTPIRIALHQLAQEKFVEFSPHLGAHVADLLSDDLEELYLLRSVVEGLGARLAVKNMTESDFDKLDNVMSCFKKSVEKNDIDTIINLNSEFHLAIVLPCKRKRIINERNKLYDHCLRYRILSYTEPAKIQDSYLEHMNILEVLKKRNPELAEEIVKNHISKAPRYIYEALKKIENNKIDDIDIFSNL